MVSFHENPEKFDNPAVMEQLTKQMFACIEMDGQLKAMDKEITTHPHYIQKCQNNSGKAIVIDDDADPLFQSSSSSFRQPI